MKVVVADTGAIISLVHINCLEFIEKIIGDFYIPEAVWIELNNYDNPNFNRACLQLLKLRMVKIDVRNHLIMTMDYGESESVILYDQLNADFLLIDDQKARLIAESLNVNCIGTLGLLIEAKRKGLVKDLKPLFDDLIKNDRYFSKRILNKILIQEGEI